MATDTFKASKESKDDSKKVAVASSSDFKEEISVYFAGKMRPSFNQIVVQIKDVIEVRSSLKKKNFNVLVDYFLKYKLKKDGIQYYYKSVGPFMSPEKLITDEDKKIDEYRDSKSHEVEENEENERAPIPVGNLFKISFSQINNCEVFFALVEPSSFGTLCEIVHAFCQEKFIVLQFYNILPKDLEQYNIYIFLAWLSLNGSYSVSSLKERYDFLFKNKSIDWSTRRTIPKFFKEEFESSALKFEERDMPENPKDFLSKDPPKWWNSFDEYKKWIEDYVAIHELLDKNYLSLLEETIQFKEYKPIIDFKDDKFYETIATIMYAYCKEIKVRPMWTYNPSSELDIKKRNEMHFIISAYVFSQMENGDRKEPTDSEYKYYKMLLFDYEKGILRYF